MATHGAADAALHEHSRETDTATLPDPPPGPNDRGAESKLGWQRAVALVGAVMLVLVELPQPLTAAHAAAAAIVMRGWFRTRRTSSARCITVASRIEKPAAK
jgi:hypothetical protein